MVPAARLCEHSPTQRKSHKPSMNSLFQVLIATLVFSLHTAHGFTLPFSEDTSASARGLLTKAAGKATTLGVAPNRTAFVRFEVGAFAPSVPPTDVTRARLTFYLPKVATSGDLTLHVTTAEWTESVAANAPQPAFDSTPLATIPVAAIMAKHWNWKRVRSLHSTIDRSR